MGVWGPADLAAYFDRIPFHPVRRPSFVRLPRRADVIHAHGLTAAAVSATRRRCPVVRTVHIDIRTQGRPGRSAIYRGVAKRIAARADAVIAVSERVARSFPGARVIAPAFPELAPPVKSRDQVRSALGTPPDEVVVITAARLHPDKNLRAFVAAVDASAAEGWICGDGPGRAQLEAITRAGRSRLLGYRTDLPDLLGAADVFALPSVGEAYGIAVVEALQAGLPVVATDAGAMPEIVGDAGLIVAAADVPAFVDAVGILVRDAERRKGLAARARERRFPSRDELVARVGSVYREVCR